jgi:hypothetical protein
MPTTPPPGFAIYENDDRCIIFERPRPPLWITAAMEALAAYQQRTGQQPMVALIGRKALQHMIEFGMDGSLLLGYPTRVMDDDPWRGVEWA